MIVLFMVVSFVIGCANWKCQSDVSVIPSRMCLFLSNHSFGPVICGFLTFPCLWKMFSSQMISGAVSWFLGLDRIFK